MPKRNLVIVASIFASISIIFFFLAGMQGDKKDYNLFIRDQNFRNIQFLAENEDNLKSAWGDSTLISEERKQAIRGQADRIGESSQNYYHFVKKERIYNNLGMISILLSIIMNASSLRLKK